MRDWSSSGPPAAVAASAARGARGTAGCSAAPPLPMLTDIVCVIVTGAAALFPAPVASSALSLAWTHGLGVLQREWVQPREGFRW
jgi:hypothetical protein